MSRKGKIVEEVIGLIGREFQSSRNREALEESGRRLLARIEDRGNESPEERREGGDVQVRSRRPAAPKSLGSRIVGAVTLLAGGLGLVAVVLLALFAFLAAPGMNPSYSEWLLPALAPVFVLATLPALWLSLRGAARLFGSGSTLEDESLSEDRKEKELLGAIERRGELTPARAAMETSLTVAEADQMLGEFANKGYLVARVNSGSLVYALWDGGRQTTRDEDPDNGEDENPAKQRPDARDWST